MDRIAILTDSVACLPLDLVEKYHINIVPAGNIYFVGRGEGFLNLAFSVKLKSHEQIYR